MTRGGYRKGSGRPTGSGKWGEDTKVVRVPASKVDAVKAMVSGEVEWPTLPLFANTVQAGAPVLAEEQIDAQVNLHEHLIRKPEASFFARAQGESMRDIGIFDGDMLVVEQQAEAKHGDIIVASVDGAMTVKRLNHNGNQIQLLSENKDFSPIEINEGVDFAIIGIVTSVIHQLK